MKVVVFLPVKGTSSRVANKNISLLDGKPLFLHTLEKLVDLSFVDEVYLDTESDEIIKLADHIPCKILRRDPVLADNKTDGNKLFMNEVSKVEADIYIQILCTSPFISPERIEEGINAVKSGEYDSAVLIKKEKLYQWSESGPAYNASVIPNSIDLPDTIVETMGLYIISRSAALKTQRRIGNKPFPLKATPLEAIDVNWPDDFILANLIAAGAREKDRMLLSNIRNHLNSPILSDILDSLSISVVVNGLSPNFEGAKIFGRAKTIKLRALKDGEDYRGIYQALNSYKTLVPNDVIVVENEVMDYAYFGEINANLAVRSGASGAIVAGMTRDTDVVKKLGFPVFAKSSKCRDVRGRATLESINKPINIFGVTISSGDLIFADGEGIVVIPRKYEKKVLQLAFEVMRKEKSVLLDIANGVPVDDLIKNNGEF